MSDLCGNEMLNLDYFNVNFLVVIFNYTFTRCYLWGKRSKGYIDLCKQL